MSTNKPNKTEDLVKGAINLVLDNGYVLYVSEDGETISRKCITGAAYSYKLADITTETFLKAIGFTLDTSDEYAEYYEIRDFNIVVRLFTFIEDIRINNLIRLVQAFEEAMSEQSGINYVGGIEPFFLQVLKG